MLLVNVHVMNFCSFVLFSPGLTSKVDYLPSIEYPDNVLQSLNSRST